MQALEKSWGATAQALKSIAEKRHWNHHSHSLLADVAKQLADEKGRRDLYLRYNTAEVMHTNIYEDRLLPDAVKENLRDVTSLVEDLLRIRDEPEPEFTPETQTQRIRWRRLTCWSGGRNRMGFIN